MFHACLCYDVLSVPCSLCGHLLEKALMSCVFLCCVFVTFQCGALGQVWYFIVSISDIRLPLYYGKEMVVWYLWMLL